jgi:pyrroloquinoline quinone (PQQ) biosynthesis protein C
MNANEALQAAFQPVREAFFRSPGIRRIQEGRIDVPHYASYLKQVFHHTRENPQLQALATVYFRGPKRDAIKRFFRHASSEIGHDQLALDDLRTLGVPTENLAFQNPLPATSALIAFPFYQINNLDPVGYLGYLYFLEFIPTGSGAAIMDALDRSGIPRAAMRFLHDHTTIDVGHNRMMEDHARTLITSERDLRSCIYAMQVTQVLYSAAIEAAFADADAPSDYGLSASECAA